MKSREIINKLLDNWPVKILSLTAAVFVFLFYRINTQKKFSIPLEVIKPPGFAIADTYPEEVQIVIRGFKNDTQVTDELKKGFRAYADLSMFKTEGEIEVNIEIEREGPAKNLGALDFENIPIKQNFILEKEAEKLLPVEIKRSGNPPRGYYIEYEAVNPANVVVKGPASHIEKATKVTTETIDLVGKTGNISKKVKILTNDQFIIPSQTNQVIYYGIISEKTETQEFSGIDINLIELDPSLIPGIIPMGKMKIEGPVLFLEKLKLNDVRLVVDCEKIKEPGEYILVTKPDTPQEVNVIDYEPETINIFFSLEEDERE